MAINIGGVGELEFYSILVVVRASFVCCARLTMCPYAGWGLTDVEGGGGWSDLRRAQFK